MPLRPLAAALALACSTALAADDIDMAEITRNPAIGNYKAYAEFKMAHYDTARAMWEALAAKGSGEALFNLGILNEEGLGLPRDRRRALEMYTRGAEAGSAKAQYRLGLLLLTGAQGSPDPEGAKRWLGAAAEAGMDDARLLLAHLSAPTGNAADEDFFRAEGLHALGRHAEAAQIWSRQAAAGHHLARTRLAWLHEAGQGLPRNLAEAGRLFRISAEAGEPEAQYALYVMLQTGKGQKADPVEARAWLERSAGQGYPAARSALASLPR